MPKTKWTEKERYIHRDLSWLAFNKRVLQEAEDPSNPLMERLKFIAIFVGNLDEFFMVRVAGAKNLQQTEITKRDRYGYNPQELFTEVKQEADELIAKVYSLYEGRLTKEMAKKDIGLCVYSDLNKAQKQFVNQYFETTLYPIITPMAVDPGHPFPILPSRTIAFSVKIGRKGSEQLAIIPLPINVPRILKLPSIKNETSFILIDDIIRHHLSVFFRGHRVREVSIFRVIRDSELSVEEEYTPDLLKAIEIQVNRRSWARAVYLECEQDCSDEMCATLSEAIEINPEEVVRVGQRIDLTYIYELIGQVDAPELCYPDFIRGKIEYENIFERIAESDFIAHVPYQSFYPTIDLISEAAQDENVLAIKMTLYRTDKDSAVISALKQAAKNKKQVTVLVEIKARFDEELNINKVRELEESGCHVIYGIPGLKIHSKMTLIVRQEEGRIRRYVHLSTGNYNEKTSRIYTDIGYFTCNEDVAKDISDVFNVITGYSMPSSWTRIVSSPNDLREYFFSLIDREIANHKKQKNGLIQAKMNSLEDTGMIDKLYQASQAGVKVQLMVRGICCLIPGVKGLSENIEVRSIVGRFLEHTRMCVFNSNGKPRYYLSSADWMMRNLDKRIELLFELTKEGIKKELQMTWDMAWKDSLKSRRLLPNRTYTKVTADKKFSFQDAMIKHYTENV